MKTTLEYIDEAKQKLGLDSDNALSLRLGITRGAMSHYKKGRSTMDDYTCIQLAGILDIDPLEIIAAANHEREQDEEKKAFWANFRRQYGRSTAAAVLLSVAASCLTSPQKANAQTVENLNSGLGNNQNIRKRMRRVANSLKSRCQRLFLRLWSKFNDVLIPRII